MLAILYKCYKRSYKIACGDSRQAPTSTASTSISKMTTTTSTSVDSEEVENSLSQCHKTGSQTTELERWQERASQMLAPAEVMRVPGNGTTPSWAVSCHSPFDYKTL